jgi:hypothetical protein
MKVKEVNLAIKYALELGELKAMNREICFLEDLIVSYNSRWFREKIRERLKELKAGSKDEKELLSKIGDNSEVEK